MFGAWIRRFTPGLRNQIIVGIAAMCWALWLTRNDAVFQNLVSNSQLQVLFRGFTGSSNGPCCLKSKREEI